MPAPRSSAAGSASSARIAGGIAGLLAIIAFIDLPYFFVPALGLAVVVGVYLSHVMAAPYPPLLGVMTYVLVTLSHVEFPEDYVDVALWRVAAIGMGVVLGTVAQLFLWPDDPDRQAPRGTGPPPAPGAIARRSGHRALGDRAGPAFGGDADARRPDRRSCSSSPMPKCSTASLRARHAEHTALILEVARLFTSALWAAETTPATTARVGLDDAVRARLLAISEESARLARALESRRGLLGSTGPTAIIPAEGGSGPGRLCPGTRPRRDGALARPDRIPDRCCPPAGAARPDGQRMTELTPGMLWSIDVSEPDARARARGRSARGRPTPRR